MKGKRRVQGGGVFGFVFGVILGASIGSGWEAPDYGVLTVGLALGLGAVGAAYGDRFWLWFCDKLWFL